MDPVQVAAIVTVLAVAWVFVCQARVATLRAKHKIEAPAVTGNPEFERAFRVHYNTIESFVMFLPLLWIASLMYSAMAAAILGGAWLAGRVIYMFGYMAGSDKRAPGAILSLLAIAGLFIVAVLGLVR